jgi:hypothetical protein
MAQSHLVHVRARLAFLGQEVIHPRKCCYGVGAVPPKFHHCTLCKSFGLTNLQELGIEFSDIPKFMPKLQRHFRHFSQTVRFLALRSPKGTYRQIIYFIGLFQHLEDLELVFRSTISDFEKETPVGDLTLIPPFVPLLRGRLTILFSKGAELLEDMIELFGGIRFRSMYLFGVGGTRLLLNACVEILETLRLHQADFRGE